jgi:hypothetical protein
VTADPLSLAHDRSPLHPTDSCCRLGDHPQPRLELMSATTASTVARGRAERWLRCYRAGDERASLRLRKDGTVDDLGAEAPIVRLPTPSVRYLSQSDPETRKLGY